MEALENSVDALFKEIQNYLFDEQDLSSQTIKALIKRQYVLEIMSAKIKEGKTLIENQLTYLKKTILADKMDEEGIKSMSLEGVGTVRVQGDIYATIKTGKLQEAVEWLCDNGHGGLVKETVNANSFTALARQYHKEGKEMPEDLFSITPYSKTILTKEKLRS